MLLGHYAAGLRQVSDDLLRERRQKYLKLMSLEQFGDRLAGQLSGGMKQKLALCCCDRVALMYSGQIHEIGTPAALRANLGLHRLEVRTANLEIAEKLLLQNVQTNIVDVQTFGDRLDVLVQDVTLGETQVNQLLQQHHPSIERGEPTLELSGCMPPINLHLNNGQVVIQYGMQLTGVLLKQQWLFLPNLAEIFKLVEMQRCKY